MQFQGSGERHVQGLSGADFGPVFSGTARIKRPKTRRRLTEIPAIAGLLLVAASSACDRSVYNTQVTQETITQTICKPGYAKAVRPPPAFTNDVKQKLLKSAGYEDTEVYKYRLDYIVPVALGGHPRKLDNFELIRRDGADNTKRKNGIEAKLQCLVCAGEVSLADALREASTDWQAAYERYAPVKCQLPKTKG
jgi:hypothetical protein